MKRQFPRPRELAPLLSFKRPEVGSVARRLARAHTIDDLRRIAKARTPAGPFDYTDGGADQEIGVGRSIDAFADLEFRPTMLRDVSAVDTTTEVFGVSSALPFGLAPAGFARMMHSAGESAVVAAAATAGVPYALSTVATTSIGALAEAAPAATKWFQLYLWKERDLSLELVAQAKAAGFSALMVTVDVPTVGNRVRDLRNGMTIPPQLSLRTLIDASYRPEWWFNFLTTKPYQFAFDHGGTSSLSKLVATLYDPTVTLEDLSWLRNAWTGPLVIKGIQSEDDAQLAFDHGADGIVVSNHGGRQLDRAPVPLHLLPRIVERVGHRGTIMLDTGIRNGADIVAAIALGADFTLIGRAYLYGLMAGGEAGVARAIEILRSEVERTMALLGCSSLSELSPEHVQLFSRRVPILG